MNFFARTKSRWQTLILIVFMFNLLVGCAGEDNDWYRTTCTANRKQAAIAKSHSIAGDLGMTIAQVWAEREFSPLGGCFWELTFTTGDSLTKFKERLRHLSTKVILESENDETAIDVLLKSSRGKIMLNGQPIANSDSLSIKQYGWQLQEDNGTKFSVRLVLLSEFTGTLTAGQILTPRANIVEVSVQYGFDEHYIVTPNITQTKARPQ
jgi:hypothetical protein